MEGDLLRLACLKFLHRGKGLTERGLNRAFTV